MSAGLPYGWKLKESKSKPGVIYYITPEGKSQWTEPSEKQIQAAKRAEKKSSSGSSSNKRSRTDTSSSSSSSSSKRNKAVPKKVRASHILVKHEQSRNPKSWRQEDTIVRTEAEARERIVEIRKNLVQQVGESNGTAEEKTKRLANFATVAQTESDCSSYKRGGDLNFFTFEKMDSTFSQKTFALKYGEISQPFKSASGIHISIRTDEGGDEGGGGSSSSSSSSSGSSEEVQVLHLLKKHTESRRPEREGKKITRTKEDAINEIKELMFGLQEVEDTDELESTFRQFAESESDCSSRRNGGDLGLFGKGKMQPSFEKASFDLAIGKMSAIIETASGVHLILRIK